MASSITLYISFNSCRTVVARPLDANLMRTQAMHQLMHQDVREKGIKGNSLSILSGKDYLRYWNQHDAEFGALHIFQHDALGPFFLNYTFIIGKVKGGRLHSMIAVAGSQDQRSQREWETWIPVWDSDISDP